MGEGSAVWVARWLIVDEVLNAESRSNSVLVTLVGGEGVSKLARISSGTERQGSKADESRLILFTTFFVSLQLP